MIVFLTKKDGFWYLDAGTGPFKTPYADTEARKTVVGYAGRAFPTATILDRS